MIPYLEEYVSKPMNVGVIIEENEDIYFRLGGSFEIKKQFPDEAVVSSFYYI